MPSAQTETKTVPDASETEARSASLTSRIYQRLRGDIISGVLEPGAKLKIEDLRARYGCGASPLREALSLLTSNQFVERLDQRGFRVAGISQEEFDQLLQTRCWAEERALRKSIANADRKWEEEVVLANFHLSREPRSAPDGFGTSERWEALHKNFHMKLLSRCSSRFLTDFCSDLYDQNVRYRMASNRLAYPAREVRAEHDAIAQAALNRDADLAAHHLENHYKTTGSFLEFGLHSPDHSG